MLEYSKVSEAASNFKHNLSVEEYQDGMGGELIIGVDVALKEEILKVFFNYERLSDRGVARLEVSVKSGGYSIVDVDFNGDVATFTNLIKHHVLVMILR